MLEPERYNIWFTNGHKKSLIATRRLEKGQNLIEYDPYNNKASNFEEGTQLQNENVPEPQAREAGNNINRPPTADSSHKNIKKKRPSSNYKPSKNSQPLHPDEEMYINNIPTEHDRVSHKSKDLSSSRNLMIKEEDHEGSLDDLNFKNSGMGDFKQPVVINEAHDEELDTDADIKGFIVKVKTSNGGPVPVVISALSESKDLFIIINSIVSQGRDC